MTTKVCSKCGEEKDAETGFYARKTSKRPQDNRCRKCQLDYNKIYAKSPKGRKKKTEWRRSPKRALIIKEQNLPRRLTNT